MVFGAFNHPVKFSPHLCALFCILWFSTFCIAQENLTNRIYTTIDSMVNNPTVAVIENISIAETEIEKQVQTDEEHVALVILQCNKAYYLQKLGFQMDAINTYEKAWNRFKTKKLSNYNIVENALIPLGNLYTKTGDLTNAENTIIQYIRLAETQKNTQQLVSGIINLSVVYHNIGNHNSAIQILKETLQKNIGTISQKQMLENNLISNLIAAKKLEEADAYLSKSKQKTNHAFLKNAAQLALLKGDADLALQYLEKSKKLLIKNSLTTVRDLAKIYVEIATIHFAANDFLETEQALHGALKILLPGIEAKEIQPENLYPENTFIPIFDLLAAISQKTDVALQYYQLSFAVTDMLLTQFTNQENKLRLLDENRLRSEKCIALLYSEYQKTKHKTHLIRAFQYAEDSKAVLIREASQRNSLIEQFPNDTLLKKQQYLLAQQEIKKDLIVRAELNNTSLNVKDRIELSEISRALKQLQNQINDKYFSINNTGLNFQTLTKKLRKDKAVLYAYFQGKQALYLFAINPESEDFIKIERTPNLEKNIQKYIAYFDDAFAINEDQTGFLDLAFEIYRALKLNLIQKNKNVLIIPDGLLSFIPFETLVYEQTNVSNYAQIPFLFKKHQLVYNLSAGAYLNTLETKYQDKLLGVFPVFENEKQPLTYSIEESKAIQMSLSATLLMRQNATKNSFKKLASQYDILHLSTHAEAGNYAIPASIRFIDNEMSVNEVYSLQIQPYLVVLSACETGIGKLQKSEGPLSIARAFQYAGAKNLVFSLWKINDKSSAEWMRNFYKSLSDSESISWANQKAKLDYLNNPNINNIQKSPYYWGAFVYYGHFHKKKSTSYYYWFLLTLVPIILGAIKLNGVKKKYN
jgi:CHAT domain-containing protein